MSASVNEPLKNKVAAQLNLFYLALSFFTRLPVPKAMHYSEALLNKANRYFSLVGIVTGLLLALSYVCFSTFLPANISIVLIMTISLLITGAFHEDGFADTCDGFGGGWTKEKILLIMKDSRLGTYGVIGIIAVLSLKFITLTYTPTAYIPLVIVSGHTISRFIATTLLFTHPYVRDTEDSKAKPSAKCITLRMLVISGMFGILPLFLFQDGWVFLTLIPAYLSKVFLGLKFKKWIGGQTGDCAGAVQQLSEIIFYLSLLVVWKFLW